MGKRPASLKRPSCSRNQICSISRIRGNTAERAQPRRARRLACAPARAATAKLTSGAPTPKRAATAAASWSQQPPWRASAARAAGAIGVCSGNRSIRAQDMTIRRATLPESLVNKRVSKNRRT